MKQQYLRPVVKIHGGKRYLAKWIISHFPENYQAMNYLEPYCGAASVLLNKEPSQEEAINDLDKGLVNILRVIRDQPAEFVSCLQKTTYSKQTFDLARSRTEFRDELDAAVNEYIVRRMSRGGLKKAFSWSERQRGGRPGDLNAWETMFAVIPALSRRLAQVYIFNKQATEVIKAWSTENTLAYVDPPYVPETRTAQKAYEFEMDIHGHVELSEVLKGFKGKVVLSGYPSLLYTRLFRDWRCVQKKVPNHASQQKSKSTKVETLWLNF